MFPPKGVQLKLEGNPGKKGRIGSKQTVTLKRKKAEYKLTYSWEAA